jgi:hypothetical protein
MKPFLDYCSLYNSCMYPPSAISNMTKSTNLDLGLLGQMRFSCNLTAAVLTSVYVFVCRATRVG